VSIFSFLFFFLLSVLSGFVFFFCFLGPFTLFLSHPSLSRHRRGWVFLIELVADELRRGNYRIAGYTTTKVRPGLTLLVPRLSFFR
jgi:hypothetical protein